MGIVSEYVRDLIAKQVDDNGLVVWYDPDGVYTAAVEALDLSKTTVMRYERSFVNLRWQIDQKKLMDGEEPPRQQPPLRNTRLAVVARNALKGVLGDETAAEVEKQVEASKLTLPHQRLCHKSVHGSTVSPRTDDDTREPGTREIQPLTRSSSPGNRTRFAGTRGRRANGGLRHSLSMGENF